jgi:type IV secretory pathway VirB3-like protein
MERPTLPEGFATPIPSTSTRPTKIIGGVPMEALAVAFLLAGWIWMAFDSRPWAFLDLTSAKPWAISAFFLIWLPAKFATKRDPWWVEVVRIRVASWLLRALRTRGASLNLGEYKAPW